MYFTTFTTVAEIVLAQRFKFLSSLRMRSLTGTLIQNVRDNKEEQVDSVDPVSNNYCTVLSWVLFVHVLCIEARSAIPLIFRVTEKKNIL